MPNAERNGAGMIKPPQAIPAGRPTAAPVYDSARTPPPFMEELLALWRYRDLLTQLITRDLTTRYKRSILGVAWTLLNPLMMMVVLTLVFSQLFRFQIRNFPVYLLSALILWTFVSQTTTNAMSNLIWGGTLLAKIYVPRSIFAVTSLGTGLVNLAISLVPLLIIAALTGLPPTWSLLTLPAAIAFSALFALGLGLLLSSLALSFRDVIDMYQIVLTAWYFLTPIIYPRSILPEQAQWLLNFNPMFHLVEAFRAPVYSLTPAGPHTFEAAAGVGLGTFVIGWLVFTARARTIPYQI